MSRSLLRQVEQVQIDALLFLRLWASELQLLLVLLCIDGEPLELALTVLLILCYRLYIQIILRRRL